VTVATHVRLAVGTTLLVLAACSSSALSPPSGIPDSGACLVEASQYTNTCTADSDCVAVPAGGNACDPCSAGSGDWSCSLTALPTAQANTYTSALSAALAPYSGTATQDQCIIQSCPTLMAATCKAGVCVVE
jgi:hypothetical protein